MFVNFNEFLDRGNINSAVLLAVLPAVDRKDKNSTCR